MANEQRSKRNETPVTPAPQSQLDVTKPPVEEESEVLPPPVAAAKTAPVAAPIPDMLESGLPLETRFLRFIVDGVFRVLLEGSQMPVVREEIVAWYRQLPDAERGRIARFGLDQLRRLRQVSEAMEQEWTQATALDR